MELFCSSLLNCLNTGFSNPTESIKIICLPLYPFNSGYLTLNPSVCIPVNNFIFEILLNIKDFPLLLFPNTPTVTKLLFLYFL